MFGGDWSTLLIGLITGGFGVKLYEAAYDAFKGWRQVKKANEQFVDQHLEPLLKSADELVGKLRSLTESDFKSIVRVSPNNVQNHEFAGLLYLFGRFWAHIDMIRDQGMSRVMANDPRGALLQKFFDCLESRRVRVVPRILQRAIGECFTEDERVIGFTRFFDLYSASEAAQKWLEPLAIFLSRMEHRSERQHLLQYGVVVHALIDTLDPRHELSSDRPGWSNKLSHRSWTALRYRVFGVYLLEVHKWEKYIGPKKKRNRAKNG